MSSSASSSSSERRDRQQEAAVHIGAIVDGKYDLCQLIAVGGVGAVYRARHRFTGRQVALKLLRDQFSKDRTMAERFLREAKAAAAVGHPCIIDVVDAGVDESVGVYVAFELLEGIDLAEAFKDRKLSIGQILDVADAVLDALEAAHRAGVVHRDIKPPNIFLIDGACDRQHVRVLDFGAAKRQQVGPDESLTVVGTVIGTPAYMSPEQAAAAPVDHACDIWAVGAVLFRAFADRPPFVAGNVHLLLACIIRDTAPSLAEFRPDLPAPIIAVIDKALQRSPNDRWRSAEEMRQALLDARDAATSPQPPRPPVVERPGEAPASSDDTIAQDGDQHPGEPAGKPSRPGRNLVIATAAAALFAAAAVGYKELAAPAAAPAVPSNPPSTTASAVPSESAPAVLPRAIDGLDGAVPSAEASSPAPPAAVASQAEPVGRKPPKAKPDSSPPPRSRVAPIREYE